MLGARTNSTAESPPTQDAPDIAGLCALKRQIVTNLPTACTHCGAELKKEYCVELKDDECIMAYCKTPGACGKSLVLFAGFDRTYPVYTQTCCFKRIEAAPVQPVVPAPVTFTAEDAPNSPPTNAPEMLSASILKELQQEQQQLDIYALHGIERPDSKCANCGKAYSTHNKTCDQNGWYESSRKCYKLPHDWPTYNSSTKTWSNTAPAAATGEGKSSFWNFKLG